MSAVRFTKLYEGQSSDVTRESRTYTAVYMVTVNDSQDGQKVVLDYMIPRVPTIWHGFERGTDVAAILESMRPSRVSGSRLHWLLECTWKTPDRDEQDNNGETSEDPDNWRDQVEKGAAKFMKPAERVKILTDLNRIGRPKDSYGPCVNAAGEIFDPAPEIEDSHGIYRITRFMTKFDADFYDSYENCVNSDVVTLKKPGLNRTFAKYTLKMEPVTGALMWHRLASGQEIAYWKVDFEVHHKRDGWRPGVLNKGRFRRALIGDSDGRGGFISGTDALDPARPQKTRIVDQDNNPAPPENLDLDGQPLKGGQAVYIDYAFYDEKPFNKLGIWGSK